MNENRNMLNDFKDSVFHENTQMLKAFGRAIMITGIVVGLIASLWYYTIITLIVLVVLWLTFMFYTDPPDEWN